MGVRFGSLPKRMRDFSMCLRISTSRSFGGAFVIQPWTRRPAAAATSSTARSKSSSFAFEGLFAPLSLRTNWSDEARISASVAGGAKLARVRMLRSPLTRRGDALHDQPHGDGQLEDEHREPDDLREEALQESNHLQRAAYDRDQRRGDAEPGDPGRNHPAAQEQI